MAKQKGRKQPKQKKNKAQKPVVLANNASARPTRASKPIKTGGPARSIMPHHTRAVCAITDPFCPASKNAKYPDGTMGNTLTQQVRGNYTVTTSASGNYVLSLVPSVPYGYLLAVAATATTNTLAAAYTKYSSANTLFDTYGQNYRVVSMGVIIRCVASATTASGTLTLGSGPALPVNTVVTLGQELYNEVVIKAIQPGMEVSWIATPMGPGARDFSAPTTTTNPSSIADWNALTLEIAGAPASTAMLSVEWFINIEFNLALNSALSAVAKPNPPKSDVAMTALSKTQNSIGSFIEGGIAEVETKVATYAKTALASIMSDPLESLASLFV
jgi:hypothetical protein